MTTPARRPIAGRLNGIRAEPGTIVGPTRITRELLVALDNDERGTTFGYATPAEIETAIQHGLAHGPRTIAEHRLLTLGRKVSTP